MKFILLSLFLSNTLLAQPISQVAPGDLISLETVNGLVAKINSLSQEILQLKKKELSVGTIVPSLLTPTQYVAQNGDCWRLADGSALASTDELRVISGLTSMPDPLTDGLFFRQLPAGSPRILAGFEDDMFESHNHQFQDVGLFNFRINTGGTGFKPQPYFNGYNHSPSVGYSSGSETRPKNIAINNFVKFKKQCSF